VSGTFKALTTFIRYRTTAMDELAAELALDTPPMIFADSGAHSAHTLGVDVSLEVYTTWCRRWDSTLMIYANLDVIKAPELTWRNQKALEGQGLVPLPVFHTGSPWRHLERYLEDGYTYIALGALQGHHVKDLMPWLAKAFRLAHGRAAFHGFGMTVWSALKEFPFYSVDSSTWGSGYRWGQLKLFDAGHWVTLPLRDTAALLRHRELIRAYGVDPLGFASHATYDKTATAGLGALAHMHAEAHLRALHGPVTVPDGPRNPLTRPGLPAAPAGLHLFLAETEKIHLRRAVAGIRAAGKDAACPS
jgi:hypothetical protein